MRARGREVFIIAGVVAVVLVALSPATSQYSTGTVLGYLGASLALVGGLVGAGLALLAERPRH